MPVRRDRHVSCSTLLHLAMCLQSCSEVWLIIDSVRVRWLGCSGRELTQGVRAVLRVSLRRLPVRRGAAVSSGGVGRCCSVAMVLGWTPGPCWGRRGLLWRAVTEEGDVGGLGALRCGTCLGPVRRPLTPPLCLVSLGTTGRPGGSGDGGWSEGRGSSVQAPSWRCGVGEEVRWSVGAAQERKARVDCCGYGEGAGAK